MKNSNLTICDYIALKAPNASYEVLMDSGLDFPKPRNKRELSAMLKKYVQVDREIALKSLARIHPDRELIESLDRDVRDADFEIRNASQRYGRKSARAMYNASGCGCAFDGDSSCRCGCKYCNQKSSFDGEQAKQYMPIFVGVGVFALLYLILDKK